MSRMKVSVSNGYLSDIHCRLTANKRLEEECAVNGGVGVNGFKLKAGLNKRFKWIPAPDNGYCKIGSGKNLKMSQIADGGCVYLSVSVNDKPIHQNFSITKNQTVIVDKDLDILHARKDNFVAKFLKGRNKWIDEEGVNHKKTLVLKKKKKSRQRRRKQQRGRKEKRRGQQREREGKKEDNTEEERGKEKDDNEVDDDKNKTPTNKNMATKRTKTTTSNTPIKKIRTEEDELDDEDDSEEEDSEDEDSDETDDD